MKAHVVGRRDRIARGADIAVMHQQVFGAEMAVKNRRQQEVAEPAFRAVLLVHQFMRVGDADRPGNHSHPEEETDLLREAEVIGARHVVDHPVKRQGLDRKPDQGDGAVPEKRLLRRRGVGVLVVLAKQRVEDRDADPAIDGQQKHGPAAMHGADHRKRDQHQREPERQGGRKARR